MAEQRGSGNSRNMLENTCIEFVQEDVPVCLLVLPEGEIQDRLAVIGRQGVGAAVGLLRFLQLCHVELIIQIAPDTWKLFRLVSLCEAQRLGIFRDIRQELRQLRP